MVIIKFFRWVLLLALFFSMQSLCLAQEGSEEFNDIFNFDDEMENILDETPAEEGGDAEIDFDTFFDEEEEVPLSEDIPEPAVSSSQAPAVAGAGSEQVVIKMLEKKEIPKQLMMKLSVASPTYVSQDLMTWNSWIDYRFEMELPMILFGAVPGLDISTYKFENALPVGGVYSGISAFLTMNRPLFPGKLTGGLGVVGSSPGVFIQQAYEFTFIDKLILSADFRLTWTSDMDGNGSVSWFDLGISPGVVLFKRD